MIQAVRNIVGAEPVGSAEARQLLDEGGAQMAKVLLALHTALETVESDRAFMDELQANQGRAQKSVAALRETSDVANDHKVVADSHEKQSQLYAGLLKHMKQPPKVPGMSEVEREAAQLLKGEQELKDTATASAVLGLGSVMSYFAQRTEEKQMQEKLGRSREKVKGLVSTAKKAIGDKVFVNILGSMSFQAPETEELVRHISTGLSSRAPSTCVFVTNGLPGTQEAFAKSCGNGKRLWNIVPSGCCSAFGNGTDLQIGADLAESRALYRELGDVYIVVEGGEGVAQDSQVAYQNGAVVIPLGRTGGASSGNNGFPSKALNRPPYISEERWSDIQSAKTATAKAAASAVHIIIDAINLKKQEIADHEHVHDMMEDEFQRHMKKEIVDAPFVILGVAPPEEQAWQLLNRHACTPSTQLHADVTPLRYRGHRKLRKNKLRWPLKRQQEAQICWCHRKRRHPRRCPRRRSARLHLGQTPWRLWPLWERRHWLRPLQSLTRGSRMLLPRNFWWRNLDQTRSPRMSSTLARRQSVRRVT